MKRDHALIAPDSHVIAPLVSWGGALGVILISPAMGARLVQTLVMLEGGTTVTLQSLSGIERCLYVLEGSLESAGDELRAGSYLYLPPEEASEFRVSESARLVTFEKRYAAREGYMAPSRLAGHASDVEGMPFMGDPDARLQVLLPDIPAFDMAVNIFTYQPGAQLPFVETHIMEHGLMMIAGEGIYRLSDSWYPVANGDCIWMAAYCPQWFAAIGKQPASYIYYKDVNREAFSL